MRISTRWTSTTTTTAATQMGAMVEYRYCWLLCLLLMLYPIDTEAQTSLLGGNVITRINVDDYANWVLDVKTIRTYIQSNNKDQIKTVYQQGLHAYFSQSSPYGLQHLSLDLASSKAQTPSYLFQLYGLSDESTDISKIQQSNAKYADNFILSTIQTNLTLVPDSILALSMWMYGTHLLYNGVLLCQERTVADQPNLIKLGGGGMDEFIALWIGADQDLASDAGQGLYGWTERVGTKLKVGATTESPPNTEIKLLYQEGAAALSIDGSCTRSNPKTVQQLYNVVVRMTRQMTIPLFQWLISSILAKDSASTKLYSLAVVPQISKCKPSLYKKMKNYMLDNEIDFSRSNDMLKDIQQAYGCYGFSCEDVGFYDENFCSGLKPLVLAGYQSTTDVSQLARIDIDIYELSTLASIGSFDFASMIYYFGANAPQQRQSESDPFVLLTLHDFATSTTRNGANPTYTNFVAYYNDKDYAHTAMAQTLDGTSKWKSLSQRSTALAMICSFQIVFLQSLVYMQQAMDGCVKADPNQGFDLTQNPLDMAAALMIGSMEGETAGGSTDLENGQLIWNLANLRAFQFGCENELGYANVNSEILNLLYAGKGELDALDCPRLDKTLSRIRSLMLVSIAQSIIRAASLAAPLPSTSQDAILAEGEVLALSLLPIINSFDSASAQIVSENMIVRAGGDTVRDGPQAVADALGYTFVHGLMLPCSYLGKTSDVDPCQKVGPGSAATSSRFHFQQGGWVAYTVLALLSPFVAILL